MPTLKTVANLKLLFVMATDAEYGDSLKSLIDPLNCGVGPVEAAINCERAVSEFRPDMVVSLGSAGSAKLEQGAIYQVSSVSYRDMDASAFGFAKGETPFLNIPITLDMLTTIPNLPVASLSTGANVVSGDAYNSMDADMADMETFAIKRVCMQHGVPLVGLRGISDGAKPVSELSDWTHLLEVIDQRLTAALTELFAALENGSAVKQ